MKLNRRLFWLATMFFLFTCAPLLCDQQAGSSSKPNETSNATLPKATANSAERGPKETEQEDAIATSGKNNAAGFAIQRRTRLVLMPALVTDRSGHHISGLKAEDFTVKDNGKVKAVRYVQEITTASADVLERTKLPAGTYSNSVVVAKAPLRVVIILFDMLNSHFKDQVPARQQLTKYLNEQVEPGTMVALLGLGRGGLRMYHDLTSDTKGLATELQMSMDSGRHSISTNLKDETSETESEEAFVGHGQFAATGSSGRSSKRLIILDTLAAFKNIAGAYASIPGRKSLVWVTGGFPFTIDGSKSGSDGMPAMDKDSLLDIMSDYQSTWQDLNDANVALYPVDMHGLQNTSAPTASYQTRRGGDTAKQLGKFANDKQNRNADNIGTFQTFAGETGGKAFYNNNDLVAGFRQAVDDTRSSYMLGYYLDQDAEPGWHKLHVEVAQSGAHIRSRAGFLVARYDATHPEAKDAQANDVQLAMTSPMNFTGIPMTVKWIDNGQAKTAAEGMAANSEKRQVPFQIILPPHTATLDETQSRVSLNFVGIARTERGENAADFVKKIDGALKPDVARRLDLAGIKFDSMIMLSPGSYNVRFVVRDNLSGRIGSVTAPVVVK
jgi:VWFA-related protein